MLLFRPLSALCLLGCAALAPCRAQDATPAPSHPALRQELMAMFAADQDLRKADKLDQAKIEKADAQHLQKIKEIVAKHGWPTLSMVSKDGAQAAWILVQHADREPEFQRQMLALMQPLLAQKQVSASDYAYLYDRTHTPQWYGTQGGCKALDQWQPREIAQAEKVDARRAEMGLSSMEEYVAKASRFLCNAQRYQAGK